MGRESLGRSIGPDLEIMRLGAIFVALCMGLIAASAGALAFLMLGVSPSESATIALASLTALVLTTFAATRINGGRSVAVAQQADLAGGVADLARQVGDLSRRVNVVEGKLDVTINRTQMAFDPLSGEMGDLGLLVKQLADSVAVHETTITELKRLRGKAVTAPTSESPPEPLLLTNPISPPLPERAVVSAPRGATLPQTPPKPAPVAEPAAPVEPVRKAADAGLSRIQSAIDANRIDLHLQPIVTLPQRKVRYYEALSRLRSENGEITLAADFIGLAERGGLMPKLDNMVVFRCVQVVRRLLLKNREVGVFCNLSGTTLGDTGVFEQLLEFLEANRAIAPSLVLEFTQDFLRKTGPIENESLAALQERGFRFSVDNVKDLRFEPRELAQRGVRFVKVSANLLLGRGSSATSDIASADLSDLLSRFGIHLIADRVESEGLVVDLLDYDVRFGQGFLFSPPRPVRAEALQGLGDRGNIVPRGAADALLAPGSGSAAPDGPAAGKRTGLAQLARRI